MHCALSMFTRRTCVAVALLLSLAACGSEPDTRPETLDYIAAAILAPQCAQASCHTAATRAHGLAFDTVASTEQALHSSRCKDSMPMIDIGNAAGSCLYQVLISSSQPMPPVFTLPDADIAVIQRWIDDGAEGYTP